MSLAANNRSSYVNTLLDIICIAILALLFIPQFKVLSQFNFLNMVLGFLWCGIAMTQQPSFFFGTNKYLHTSFLFSFFAVVMAFFCDNIVIANRYSSFMMVPIFYWIYNYNSTNLRSKSNVKITIISSIFICYTAFNTIIQLLKNPFAARSIKTSAAETVDLIEGGASGYELIYAAVILVIVIVSLLLERKRLKINPIAFFLLLLCEILLLYLIFLSNYFTALLVSISGILLLFFMYYMRRLLFLFMPLSLLFFVMQKDISLAVADLVMSFTQPDTRNYQRFEAIKRGIERGANAEDVDTRSEVLNTSLDLFFDYPTFGYVMGSNSSFNLDKVGQHSYVLDTYAMYGIFLGTFSVWTMWLPFRYRISNRYNYRSRVFGWVTGIAFMIVIIFNNLTATVGYAAFFVFPTVFDYLNKKRYE